MGSDVDAATRKARDAARSQGGIPYLHCVITAGAEPAQVRSIRLIPTVVHRNGLSGAWLRYRLVYKCFSTEPSTSPNSTKKNLPAVTHARQMDLLGILPSSYPEPFMPE